MKFSSKMFWHLRAAAAAAATAAAASAQHDATVAGRQWFYWVIT